MNRNNVKVNVNSRNNASNRNNGVKVNINSRNNASNRNNGVKVNVNSRNNGVKVNINSRNNGVKVNVSKLRKMSKDNITMIIISIAIIIILIIIIVILYFYFKKKYSEELYIERQDSNKPVSFDKELIKLPKDGYNYSMCFFIYLNNYTDNFKYWKHVLHKGKDLRNQDILDYTDWNILTEDMLEQSPGIWINQKNTFIRICFTTEIYKNLCEIKTKTGCIDKCEWVNNKCITKDNHAKNIEDRKSIKNMTIKEHVEYVDLEIPYKKLTHIGIVLENRILNVYFNGKLRKIHKFLGDPLFYNKNMYFNQQYSYNGSLFNFNYIPYEINNKQIEYYSNDLPNISLIPKKVRFNNYIRRFKLMKAIQSFFI